MTKQEEQLFAQMNMAWNKLQQLGWKETPYWMPESDVPRYYKGFEPDYSRLRGHMVGGQISGWKWDYIKYISGD